MNNDNFWDDQRAGEYAALFLQEAMKNISAIQMGEKFTKFTTAAEFKASNTSSKEEVGWEIVEMNNKWDGVHKHTPYCGNTITCTIHSVLRKSDGLIFTVKEDTPDGIIERFEKYNEYHIKVWLKGNKYLWFHTLEKLPKRTKPERNGSLSREMEMLEERIAYIEKKLNIEG